MPIDLLAPAVQDIRPIGLGQRKAYNSKPTTALTKAAGANSLAMFTASGYITGMTQERRTERQSEATADVMKSEWHGYSSTTRFLTALALSWGALAFVLALLSFVPAFSSVWIGTLICIMASSTIGSLAARRATFDRRHHSV